MKGFHFDCNNKLPAKNGLLWPVFAWGDPVIQDYFTGDGHSGDIPVDFEWPPRN